MLRMFYWKIVNCEICYFSINEAIYTGCPRPPSSAVPLEIHQKQRKTFQAKSPCLEGTSYCGHRFPPKWRYSWDFKATSAFPNGIAWLLLYMMQSFSVTHKSFKAKLTKNQAFKIIHTLLWHTLTYFDVKYKTFCKPFTSRQSHLYTPTHRTTRWISWCKEKYTPALKKKYAIVHLHFWRATILSPHQLIHLIIIRTKV